MLENHKLSYIIQVIQHRCSFSIKSTDKYIFSFFFSYVGSFEAHTHAVGKRDFAG